MEFHSPNEKQTNDLKDKPPTTLNRQLNGVILANVRPDNLSSVGVHDKGRVVELEITAYIQRRFMEKESFVHANLSI